MSSTLNDLLAATSANSPTLEDLTRSVDGYNETMLSPVRRSSRPQIPNSAALEREQALHQATRAELDTTKKQLEAIQAELQAARNETALISAMSSSVETELSLTKQELAVYRTNVDQCTVIRSELEALRWDDLEKSCKREANARQADRQMLAVLQSGLEAFRVNLVLCERAVL